MATLSSTHLYGRHLVIEWAKEEADNLNELRKRAKSDAGAISVVKKSRRADAKAIEGAAEEDNIDEGDL